MSGARTAAGFPAGPLAVAAALVGAWLAAGPFAQPYANPDSHAFESLTQAVLAGRGFTYREPMLPGLVLFAYRAPVFPLLAAPAYALGGVPIVLALQGALAGATAALIAAMAARAGGRPAGWIAFVLAMTWPPTWELAGQYLSETLYTALSVLAVWSAWPAARPPLRAGAASGAFAAAAALTRSIGAAAALPLGAWWFARHRRGFVAFALAGLLVWLPWPVRNAARLHAFVPFTTNAAMNFYSGNSGVPPDACWRDMAAHVERGELGFERAFAERSRDEVLAHPDRFTVALAHKAFGYVVPMPRNAASAVHRGVLVVLAVACFAVPAAWAPLALPGLVWAAQAVASVLTVTNARYRSPTDWVLLLAAALVLPEIARRHGRRGLAWTLGAGVLGAATLLLPGLWR